jgi:hypothetical protein
MEETERKPSRGGIQNYYYGTVQKVINVQHDHKRHKTHNKYRIKTADISINSPGNQIIQQQKNGYIKHGE